MSRQKLDYVKRYARIKPFVKFRFKRPNQLGPKNKAKITRYWKKLKGLSAHYVPIKRRNKSFNREFNSELKGHFPELKVNFKKRPRKRAYYPPAEKYEIIRHIKDLEPEPFEPGPEIPPESELIAPPPKQYAETRDIPFDPEKLEKDISGYITGLIKDLPKAARIKVICGGDMTGKPLVEGEYGVTERTTGTAFLQGAFYPDSPNALINEIEKQVNRYDWKAFLIGLRVFILINQE